MNISLPSAALLVASLSSALALSGCSSLRASEDVPPGLDLSGQWKLVSPAPETAKHTIEVAVDDMHQKRQRRMRGFAREGGEREGPYGDLPMSAPFPSPQSTDKQLEEFGVPPASFEIKQASDSLQFIYAGSRQPRRVRPGATAAIGFLEYDTANVVCGWNGHAFLIQTKSPELATIDERYELAEKGQQLHVTIRMEGQLVRGIEIKAVYEKQ